jgi:hypothetical protein
MSHDNALVALMDRLEDAEELDALAERVQLAQMSLGSFAGAGLLDLVGRDDDRGAPAAGAG